MVVAGKPIREQFTNAVNGFTVEVTQEQAEMISRHPEVAFVQRSKIYDMHTDAGPDLIEADKIWSGEATSGLGFKGEGLIVGVIDSGINSDHPSFAARAGDGYQHENPFGPGVYVGDCELAEFAERCNDKLIGIRSYSVITDAYTTGELGATVAPVGEDYHGHGSHVAATVAGNQLFDQPLSFPEFAPEADGQVLKPEFFAQMSGVAPRANIISYQVCQPSSDVVGGCPGEALLAGIEDAVADGVDVINFSIGGQDSHPWSDAVEMAFLGAREAGILVAAAAGNGGQAGGYEEYMGAIDHASPWLLNVAATTHDRELVIETQASDFGFANENEAGSRLPDATEISGGAINETGVTGVLVHAEDYANINGEYDRYCGSEYASGTFDYYPDGTLITDTYGNAVDVIVACARDDLNNPNGIARTAKSDNIKAGSADGYVLYNYGSSDPIATTSSYSLPAIHISRGAWYGDFNNGYYGLEDWLTNNGRGHMMTIQPTLIEAQRSAEYADWLAPFSSRGPSPSTPESLIPAVAAPGVDIYSAWSDEQPFSPAPAAGDFTFLSGTSMASPHAAGALALLKQAHPDWSPAEIQSALVMTADEGVRYRFLNRDDEAVFEADTYRAGTGRINVENAVQSGLVMDETADNFAAADPLNGGQVHRLNLPQLVDFSCKPQCTWIRTVKATKDGTWTVSADPTRNWSMSAKSQFEQQGVNIDIQPAEFSLRAGETQNIVVTASIMDTQDIFSNSEVELHSTLRFAEVSGTSPEAHWPVVFKYDNNGMPSKLETVAHRNDGEQLFSGIQLPEGHNVGRVFAPVKADHIEVTLPKDDDGSFPWDTRTDPATAYEDRIDEAVHTEWVYVAEGSKRLIAEVTGLVESPLEGDFDLGNFLVYVGKDYNGNNEIDIDSEILCMSNHVSYHNFCNINSPEEGNYWVLFYNARGGSVGNYYEDLYETYTAAIAVVGDSEATNMTVDVPYSDGQQGTDVALNWSMPGMEEGDIYYSLIDFGTSAANAGNIGKVSLKLTRGADDVELVVPQTRVKKGDVLPITFKVLANQSGRDRSFTIDTTIPEGLLIRGLDTKNSAIVTELEQDGEQVLISGIQPDTASVQPHYDMTTNLTNAQCRTPDVGNSNPGGYINLADFGIYPLFGGFAPVEIGDDGRVLPRKDGFILHRTGIVVPIAAIFNGGYDSFHLYNNTEQLNTNIQNSLEIRGTGMVSLWEGAPVFGNFHFPYPYDSFPYEQVSPLWRAGSFNDDGSISRAMMSVPLNSSPFKPEGISLASTTSGWGIVEFDDARSYDYAGRSSAGEYLWEERDDRFDFQLLFNVNTRFGDDEYELIMAYDNIDWAGENGRGSIGVQGFRGQAHRFGPLQGYLGEQYAYNDLQDKISDDLLVCYDYVGPESSQFEVTVLAEVGAVAVGRELVIKAVSSIEGMADIEMEHVVTAPSNITVGEISDQSIDENTSLEDLVIYYADEENSVNEISVQGENITSVVDDHESGAAVTITPDENFHGDVEVTVTVSDVENPGDAASTSFTLTVVSDGEEPEEEAQKPSEPAPETPRSSSGSFGWWMLSLLGLVWMRRRV
ncbi:S8 family serine peptidase [Pseudidiomarina sp. 1APP75-32.1]|uniref:S8 family serine peptidase n=2 Tax=Pseudidiomarina terrestris TaxID=2820060 RepID=A0AAW7R3Z9_9GAMM|nr:S8 family serine peptidase [Pseudidiomarina sp. 1APP75-32.1]